jgi:hypothetical protein
VRSACWCCRMVPYYRASVNACVFVLNHRMEPGQSLQGTFTVVDLLWEFTTSGLEKVKLYVDLEHGSTKVIYDRARLITSTVVTHAARHGCGASRLSTTWSVSSGNRHL